VGNETAPWRGAQKKLGLRLTPRPGISGHLVKGYGSFLGTVRGGLVPMPGQKKIPGGPGAGRFFFRGPGGGGVAALGLAGFDFEKAGPKTWAGRRGDASKGRAKGPCGVGGLDSFPNNGAFRWRGGRSKKTGKLFPPMAVLNGGHWGGFEAGKNGAGRNPPRFNLLFRARPVLGTRCPADLRYVAP